MLNNLIELYADRVISGKRTIEQVPLPIREKVKKIVEENKEAAKQ